MVLMEESSLTFSDVMNVEETPREETTCRSKISPRGVAAAFKRNLGAITRTILQEARKAPHVSAIEEPLSAATRRAQGIFSLWSAPDGLAGNGALDDEWLERLAELVGKVEEAYIEPREMDADALDEAVKEPQVKGDIAAEMNEYLEQVFLSFREALARRIDEDDGDEEGPPKAVDLVGMMLEAHKGMKHGNAKRLSSLWMTFLASEVFRIGGAFENEQSMSIEYLKRKRKLLEYYQALKTRHEKIKEHRRGLNLAKEKKPEKKAALRQAESQLTQVLEAEYVRTFATETKELLLTVARKKVEIAQAIAEHLKARTQHRATFFRRILELNELLRGWLPKYQRMLEGETRSVEFAVLRAQIRLEELNDEIASLKKQLPASLRILHQAYPDEELWEQLEVKLEGDGTQVVSCPPAERVVGLVVAHVAEKERMMLPVSCIDTSELLIKVFPETTLTDAATTLIPRFKDIYYDDVSSRDWQERREEMFNFPKVQKMLSRQAGIVLDRPGFPLRRAPFGPRLDAAMTALGDTICFTRVMRTSLPMKMLVRADPFAKLLASLSAPGQGGKPGCLASEAILLFLLGNLAAIGRTLRGARLFSLLVSCRSLQLRIQALKAALHRSVAENSKQLDGEASKALCNLCASLYTMAAGLSWLLSRSEAVLHDASDMHTEYWRETEAIITTTRTVALTRKFPITGTAPPAEVIETATLEAQAAASAGMTRIGLAGRAKHRSDAKGTSGFGPFSDLPALIAVSNGNEAPTPGLAKLPERIVHMLRFQQAMLRLQLSCRRWMRQAMHFTKPTEVDALLEQKTAVERLQNFMTDATSTGRFLIDPTIFQTPAEVEEKLKEIVKIEIADERSRSNSAEENVTKTLQELLAIATSKGPLQRARSEPSLRVVSDNNWVWSRIWGKASVQSEEDKRQIQYCRSDPVLALPKLFHEDVLHWNSTRELFQAFSVARRRPVSATGNASIASDVLSAAASSASLGIGRRAQERWAALKKKREEISAKAIEEQKQKSSNATFLAWARPAKSAKPQTFAAKFRHIIRGPVKPPSRQKSNESAVRVFCNILASASDGSPSRRYESSVAEQVPRAASRSPRRAAIGELWEQESNLTDDSQEAYAFSPRNAAGNQQSPWDDGLDDEHEILEGAPPTPASTRRMRPERRHKMHTQDRIVPDLSLGPQQKKVLTVDSSNGRVCHDVVQLASLLPTHRKDIRELSQNVVARQMVMKPIDFASLRRRSSDEVPDEEPLIMLEQPLLLSDQEVDYLYGSWIHSDDVVEDDGPEFILYGDFLRQCSGRASEGVCSNHDAPESATSNNILTVPTLRGTHDDDSISRASGKARVNSATDGLTADALGEKEEIRRLYRDRLQRRLSDASQERERNLSATQRQRPRSRSGRPDIHEATNASNKLSPPESNVAPDIQQPEVVTEPVTEQQEQSESVPQQPAIESETTQQAEVETEEPPKENDESPVAESLMKPRIPDIVFDFNKSSRASSPTRKSTGAVKLGPAISKKNDSDRMVEQQTELFLNALRASKEASQIKEENVMAICGQGKTQQTERPSSRRMMSSQLPRELSTFTDDASPTGEAIINPEVQTSSTKVGQMASKAGWKRVANDQQERSLKIEDRSDEVEPLQKAPEICSSLRVLSIIQSKGPAQSLSVRPATATATRRATPELPELLPNFTADSEDIVLASLTKLREQEARVDAFEAAKVEELAFSIRSIQRPPTHSLGRKCPTLGPEGFDATTELKQELTQQSTTPILEEEADDDCRDVDAIADEADVNFSSYGYLGRPRGLPQLLPQHQASTPDDLEGVTGSRCPTPKQRRLITLRDGISISNFIRRPDSANTRSPSPTSKGLTPVMKQSQTLQQAEVRKPQTWESWRPCPIAGLLVPASVDVHTTASVELIQDKLQTWPVVTSRPHSARGAIVHAPSSFSEALPTVDLTLDKPREPPDGFQLASRLKHGKGGRWLGRRG